MSALLLSLALAVSIPQDAAAQPAGKLTFEAPDGLVITAEYHPASTAPGTPLLVLFHQARSSRGEYRPMLPRLEELGFNCFAVDLRSGGRMQDVKNATNRLAKQKGKGTSFVDALPDMLAALEYGRAHYAPAGTELVAWGSSYSSSLVVAVAAAHPELVDGVISFAPGEYFKNLGRSATWIEESAADVQCPVFMTGARAEERQWRPIFEALATADKVGFVPDSKGQHGSRALWPASDASADYWKALEGFLERYFPRQKKSD